MKNINIVIYNDAGEVISLYTPTTGIVENTVALKNKNGNHFDVCNSVNNANTSSANANAAQAAANAAKAAANAAAKAAANAAAKEAANAATKAAATQAANAAKAAVNNPEEIRAKALAFITENPRRFEIKQLNKIRELIKTSQENPEKQQEALTNLGIIVSTKDRKDITQIFKKLDKDGKYKQAGGAKGRSVTPIGKRLDISFKKSKKSKTSKASKTSKKSKKTRKSKA